MRPCGARSRRRPDRDAGQSAERGAAGGLPFHGSSLPTLMAAHGRADGDCGALGRVVAVEQGRHFAERLLDRLTRAIRRRKPLA